MTIITAWALHQSTTENVLRLARSIGVYLADLNPSTPTGRTALERRVLAEIKLSEIRDRAAKRRAAA